ncbi:MAG: RNA polymerase sigma factor [Phycisphaerales bacterium]
MSRTLLQRVAAAEPGAVRSCLDQFGGLVWSLARRFAPTDAEDAAQEIFIDLWKSAGRYDPAVASEATFVSMIARRRLIDRRRRATRRPEPMPLADQALPGAGDASDPMTVSEDAGVAAQALAALSPDQQNVIRLSVYRGLSHDEIASATGLPLGTVKTHIRRGLIRVREALDATRGRVGTGASA